MDSKQERTVGISNEVFKKIDEKENLFGQIVAHMNDAVVIVDMENVVRAVNPSAEKLFARSADEMIGKKFDYSVHSGEPAFRPIPYQKLEIKRAGGSIIAEVNVTELKLHGRTYFMASCRDVTELVELRQKKKEELPLFDEFTGLYNKRGLFTLAQYQMKMAERTKKGMWMMVIDLDNFAKITSILGTEEGEKALLETASILQKTFRSSDIIAHIESNEFATIAIGSNKDSANALKSRIQKNIDRRNENNDNKYKLSISIGMAYFDPESPCKIEELLAKARSETLKY